VRRRHEVVTHVLGLAKEAMASRKGSGKIGAHRGLDCLNGPTPDIDRKRIFPISSHPLSASDELRSIANAIERLGCRMGEDPERAIIRKEALADRVRAVAARIGGAA
jgi:hypothetical protein